MLNRSEPGGTKIGVVGYGYWGPKLVRNLSDSPRAMLSWVADLDPERLTRLRDNYPMLRVTQSYDEMLQSDIEAVLVATPIRTHYRLAKAALLANKHVMVEKPLTASSAEAEELTQLAAARGLTLMVGHTFEYNGAIRALRDIVRSGELGRIYYVDAARLNLGLFQPDINVVWDLAPHDLSILLYVLGLDPLSVSARGSANVRPGIHDVAYIEVNFPGGILAHLHLSWLDPCKVRRVTIVGSKKMVVCNDLADSEKIRIYDKGIEQPYETDRFSDFSLQYRYGDVTIPYVPFQEPLRVQVEHFIDSIRNGTRPQSDGHVGKKVVEILERIDHSLLNGGARADRPGRHGRGGPPEGSDRRRLAPRGRSRRNEREKPMATEVLLPKLGMNTEAATIVAWRKREGDRVAVGEVLAEVETDKAVIELEAETAGTLRRLLAADGARVGVNEAIAIVGTADEDIAALEARLAAAPPATNAHVERVYQSWTGNGHAAEPAPSAVLRRAPPPPARPARDAGFDLAAIRNRLTGRGIIGDAPHQHGNGHAVATLPLAALAPAKPAPARIAIYGGGLGAKQLLEITRHLDTIAVVGVIDDNPKLANERVGGVPVLGGFAALRELYAAGQIAGVALTFHSEVRRRVHRRLKDELGIPLITLIDPSAHVGMDVTIGAGALIEAGAVVGPGTELGEGVIVDVGAVVAHDCFLGPFSHLSPGCTLSGAVCLRGNVLVGVGAVINSTVTIGRNAIITPGAAVMNDLPDDVIVGGVPAKVMGASRRGA